MRVRCRFAPSPTGPLHLGGARTALFNWLLARRHAGVFLLRIDDTDRVRSSRRHLDSILEALGWLGLDWDEGPVLQSSRLDRHAEAARTLVSGGHAYPCTCTPAELEARRAGRGYDRFCRDGHVRAPSHPPSIRFRMPLEGRIDVGDAIRGRVSFDASSLDDLVIVRADGMPTYNFASVVDDADLAVTHVVRGDDLLNSAPLQVQIARALGVVPPVFAHLPLVMGSRTERLSKRHGARSVLEYRDEGYLPSALLDYLARLGWDAGGSEVAGVASLVDAFSLDRLGRSACVFDPRKLTWTNQRHIQALAPEVLASLALSRLEQGGLTPLEGLPAVALVALHRRSARTLADLAHHLEPFCRPLPVLDPAVLARHLSGPGRALLERVRGVLAALASWEAPALESAVRSLAAGAGVELVSLAQPLRVALTGRTVSPGIFELSALLGRDLTLARIDAALLVASEDRAPST